MILAISSAVDIASSGFAFAVVVLGHGNRRSCSRSSSALAIAVDTLLMAASSPTRYTQPSAAAPARMEATSSQQCAQPLISFFDDLFGLRVAAYGRQHQPMCPCAVNRCDFVGAAVVSRRFAGS